MQHRIDLYFLVCKSHQTENPDLLKGLSKEDLKIASKIDDIYPSVTGLALALGFSDRRSLIDYSKKEEFFHTVKSAKLRVENAIEQRLFYQNATGSIFNLKNNFDWRDKSESDVNNRYVDKEGEDLHAKDLEIINNYEQRIKGQKDD